MGREPRGEADAEVAVAILDEHLTLAELALGRQLTRCERGRNRCPGRGELRDGGVAVEIGDRAGDRGIARIDAVEAFPVRQRREVGEPECVAHRPPEVIFGDDRQRHIPAIGGAEHAVAR